MLGDECPSPYPLPLLSSIPRPPLSITFTPSSFSSEYYLPLSDAFLSCKEPPRVHAYKFGILGPELDKALEIVVKLRNTLFMNNFCQKVCMKEIQHRVSMEYLYSNQPENNLIVFWRTLSSNKKKSCYSGFTLWISLPSI